MFILILQNYWSRSITTQLLKLLKLTFNGPVITFGSTHDIGPILWVGTAFNCEQY